MTKYFVWFFAFAAGLALVEILWLPYLLQHGASQLMGSASGALLAFAAIFYGWVLGNVKRTTPGLLPDLSELLLLAYIACAGFLIATILGALVTPFYAANGAILVLETFCFWTGALFVAQLLGTSLKFLAKHQHNINK